MNTGDKILYWGLGSFGAALVLAGAIGACTSHRHRSSIPYNPAPISGIPIPNADNTNYDQKPLPHSTTPMFSNPDGTSEGNRALREGEKLEDVLKEGPTTRFDPKKQLDIHSNQDYNNPNIPKTYNPNCPQNNNSNKDNNTYGPGVRKAPSEDRSC